MIGTTIKNRWRHPQGYKAVLKISLPLVISLGSITMILFTDRMFLGWYSMDALAAVTPGGLTSFMFICFFLGISQYVNTFVAQYTGSNQPKRVGAAIWQGLYFGLAAGLLLALCSLTAKPLFALSGHPEAVQILEVQYFSILMIGGGLLVLRDALSSFYSGRGLTQTIMWVNLAGAAVNIPLDYFMINGVGVFPEMGVSGAAWASVISQFLMFALFLLLTFRKKHDERYGVLKNWKFDPALMGRLLRFGLPNGLQFFVDVFAFTFFLFVIGKMETEALAATNVAFAINTLGFLPMIGFSIAVSTMVGQSIGRGQPDEGAYATSSAMHITFAYMFTIALVFFFAPGPLVDLFKPHGYTSEEYAALREIGVNLMRFVAFFSLFDTFCIINAAALKGAGDTRFVGWSIAILSTSLMVIPVYIGVYHLSANIYQAWAIVTFYICVIALVFRWRFKQGKWKSMRVIEDAPPHIHDKAGLPGVDELMG